MGPAEWGAPAHTVDRHDGDRFVYPGKMLRGETWSEIEVEATVADYFAMLEKELRRESYSKTDHRRALKQLLQPRSDTAVERKHQNISAVLNDAHFPYINGYKPLSNYQAMLADVVLEHLEEDAVLSHLALRFAETPPRPVTVDDVLQRMVKPPDILASVRTALQQHVESRRARRIDYLGIEARNRVLGGDGEEFVVTYEQARLNALGLTTLARRVERVTVTQGDGLGFDVLSFDDDSQEHFIEVKTTQLSAVTPFFISSNEVSFSSEHASQYSLYRVFGFGSDPRMFALRGPVEATCTLRAAAFEARPR